MVEGEDHKAPTQLFGPKTSDPVPAGGKPARTESSGTSVRSQSAGRAGTSARGRKRQDASAGADLERRVARVEFAEGALARTAVPVAVEGEPGRTVLTDIDVLTVDVDLRLRVSTGINECKSGAGQSGEPDRLLWLSGFQRYLNAQRATLVRQTVTRRGQAVARRLGVRVLDVATLERRELAHGWMPERFAHVAGEECAAAENRMNSQLRGLPTIPSGLVSFLRHEAISAQPHRAVAALVALRAAVEEQGVLPEPAGGVLAGHALLALVAAATRDAGHLEVVPAVELRTRLGLALTVGNPDDSHVLDVLSDADALLRSIVEDVHAAYTGAGAARVELEIPSLAAVVAEPPEGVTDRYVDLVERLRSNPLVARDMLQCTELACFEALLGGDAWRSAAFDHLFTPEHKQLLTYAVASLAVISGPQLARHLKAIGDLPFERRLSSVPDRRGS